MCIKSVFVVCLVLIVTETGATRCNSQTEVKYDKWCFKLAHLTFDNTDSIHRQFAHDCEQFQTDKPIRKQTLMFESCLKFLKLFLRNLLGLYLNNRKINGNYQFAVFESPLRPNRATNTVWSKLRRKYFDEQETNDPVASVYVFQNLYAYKGFYYIENEVFNDNEKANIMIYGSNNHTHEQQCVFANQIQDNNENFRFYYGDCDQRLPFICIKPYSMRQLEMNYPVEGLYLVIG
jgi:hypothetical protein